MESLLIIIVLIVVVMFGLEIYSNFDHSYTEPGKTLDENAEIVKMDSEQVKYVRNNAKFKTTVTFSDGFTFVTHKTKKEYDGLRRYTISIEPDTKLTIINNATEAHRKAVEKSKTHR